ncbi:hypothetical protein CH64_696 [Yersinia rohdei]|uniref:Uncharacterized protein n=1 Tax=Yersinia rohdei TaxID=29485 RepID=A0A0U1HP62_YERRO|nr:hypothetical protein CH64_696 [Yersinia rohdei]CNE07916.1 Uncharacterised protein [Yersinia rohdei]CNI34716.1 Uncharacterised protein [Yersinia rohdei]CQI88385.1 Uncharacterised protein [Yersinia rohdei]CQJ46645.1 Uncharacterised protein [Yersinia rohdei]
MASQLSLFHTANGLKSTIRQRDREYQFQTDNEEDNNEVMGSKMLL